MRPLRFRHVARGDLKSPTAHAWDDHEQHAWHERRAVLWVSGVCCLPHLALPKWENMAFEDHLLATGGTESPVVRG